MNRTVLGWRKQKKHQVHGRVVNGREIDGRLDARKHAEVLFQPFNARLRNGDAVADAR